MNITDLITIQSKERAKKSAVKLYGRSISYRYLEQLILRMTVSLHTQGVREGDVIAHVFSDELSLLISMCAVNRLGGTVFSLPINTPSLYLKEKLHSINANLIVTDVQNLCVNDIKTCVYQIEMIEKLPETMDNTLRSIHPRTPCLIIEGSGSTGKPKLIPVSHEQLFYRVKQNGENLSFNETHNIGTLSHVNFFVGKLRFWNAMLSGGSFCILNHLSLPQLMIAKKLNVNVLYVSVFHMEMILKKLQPNVKDFFSTLNILAISASTVTESLRRRVRSLLTPNLYVLYGTNEITPLSTVFPHMQLQQPMSVGFPVKDVDIEIVDENDIVLPANHIGNIRVKSKGMVSHYLNDINATQKAFRDGWFYPGDLGKFAHNGELIYCGRSDHMMIMNGINIYPAEIEEVISQHPYVLDATVIPMKHPIHQDIPVCAVTIVQDSEITSKDLMCFCYEKLSFRAPKEVVILENIPRNNQGKLIRDELVKILAAYIKAQNQLLRSNS